MPVPLEYDIDGVVLTKSEVMDLMSLSDAPGWRVLQKVVSENIDKLVNGLVALGEHKICYDDQDRGRIAFATFILSRPQVAREFKAEADKESFGQHGTKAMPE